MKRRHLFEFEDLPWFPRQLRDMVTDFLQQSLVLRMGSYRPVVPLLAEVLQAQETDAVVDLCSGATGPWADLKPALDEALGRPTGLVLTDLHPNLPAFRRLAEEQPGVEHVAAPVPATEVPAELAGVRTLFTSLHHFPPDEARRILRDAYERRAAICAFEFTERTWTRVLLTPVLAPLLLAVTTPGLKPRRPSRFLFTYLLPLVPVAVVWDGVVSNLRTYLPEELDEMVHDLRSPDYVWETGRLHSPDGGSPVTYLVGHRTPLGDPREARSRTEGEA